MYRVESTIGSQLSLLYTKKTITKISIECVHVTSTLIVNTEPVESAKHGNAPFILVLNNFFK